MTVTAEPASFRARDGNAWRSLVSKVVLSADMEMPRSQTFEGRIRSFTIFDLGIFSMICQRHAAHRAAKYTADREPEIVLSLQRSGFLRLRQNGREVKVRPGEFAFYVSYDPVEINASDDYESLAVKIPLSRCRGSAEQFRDMSVRTFAADEGLAPAVWSMAEQLEEGADIGSQATASRVSHHIIGLMEQMLHQQLGEPSPRETPAEAIRERCLRYIEAHLQDSELTPQRIAEANFVSTRYLHLVFQETETTVAGYIRERRIERVQEDLSDAHLQHLSVEALARRWGFTNVSHFGQLFKKATGVSPAHYRRLALGV